MTSSQNLLKYKENPQHHYRWYLIRKLLQFKPSLKTQERPGPVEDLIPVTQETSRWQVQSLPVRRPEIWLV